MRHVRLRAVIRIDVAVLLLSAAGKHPRIGLWLGFDVGLEVGLGLALESGLGFGFGFGALRERIEGQLRVSAKVRFCA